MNSKSILPMGKSEDFYKEKVDVIAAGTCKSIVPVSIAYRGDNLIGYYNIDGFKRISHYSQLTAESILTFLELFFFAMEDCQQFLIFPEEYVINTNTVYVDDSFKTVKFTYISDKDNHGTRTKVKYFINELGKLTTTEGKTYLNMLKELVDVENISYRKIRMFIEKLKHDAKKCHCF